MSSRSAAEIIVDEGGPFLAAPAPDADGVRAAAFLELARFGAFLSGLLFIDVSSPRRNLKEQRALFYHDAGHSGTAWRTIANARRGLAVRLARTMQRGSRAAPSPRNYPASARRSALLR